MQKNNHTIKKGFVRLLGNERYQAVSIPLFAIVLSLLAGAVVIFALGKNPLVAYQNLLQGSGILPKATYAGHKSMLTDFMSFMNAWTPMLFASLAVAVALRAGLFNIGVSGQMLVAGFVTTLLVGYSDLPAPVAKPLVLICGIISGALVGALIGWMKEKFNINEVVSSIMINYIAQYVISFFINTYYVNPVSRQSNPVSKASRLTLMDTTVGDLKMDIPLGIVLAIIIAIAVKFLLDRTTFGYELKSVGTSRNAAKYAGIKVGRSMVMAFVVSGALAGLAGVTYYLGYFGSIQPKVLASTGFDSIAVSLLANSNPIGIIFSSFLITVISKGSTYMNSASGLESEIASVITGVILLFSACGAFIRYKVKSMKEELKESEERGNR
ncbi:ABC transporter permease [Brotaphodocola catenula]|uniref:ABC transporter permease n=1 Tax=Brotaphodocola catenula TaxID=2885361 RepID=A0AAE3DI94_9FIRM|nr:ABC transporter permease [Brotaphodocola catenula]MCC2164805.1 ABC transporter permease [Brotaphodocola catenula]